jgi:hypothetical protein
MEAGRSDPSGKSSFLPSILIILALLLMLSGAGYGLWLVLQTPPSDISETTKSAPPTSNAEEPKNPIQKVQETIATVKPVDLEAIEADQATNPAVASPTSETGTDDESPSKNLTVAAPTPQPTNTEDYKAIVSEYLAGIHVSGVRDSERPMVIIGGKSYFSGEILLEEPGLTFIGFRDKRIAFRDSNGIVYLKSF